jgi:hypothetical protein
VFKLDPTDILVLVLMAIFAMRRMDVRATDPRCFRAIPRGDFDSWKNEALRARTLAINACFAKFALNNIWFYGFRNRVILPVLATGGWIIFLGWIFAMCYAWWLSSTAKSKAERLGIVVGRRIVEEPSDRTGEG